MLGGEINGFKVLHLSNSRCWCHLGRDGFFFFDQMGEPSKLIFYAVTSWLLFLIVLFGKKVYRDRQAKKDKGDKQEK